MAGRDNAVYMMTNRSRRTLYTGVTNNLERRVWEHQQGIGSEFTTKYRVHILVYYENYPDIRDAIVREKQIKGWRRSKKEALIAEMNPEWRDLSLDWRD